MIYHGDCLEIMAEFEDNVVDTILCDPPYGLSTEPDIIEVLTHWLAGDDYEHRGGGFMGKSWDSFVPGPSVWRECLRVLKPGGLALVFGGTRTYDLTTIALRMAGFRIVDVLQYLYGSGFPKALDISAKLDQRAGVKREVSDQLLPGHSQGRNRTFGTNGQGIYGEAKNSVAYITAPATDLAKQWHGWKSPHLKPAWEPIILAEAPREGSYADNATKWGVAGLWIEGGRIGTEENRSRPPRTPNNIYGNGNGTNLTASESNPNGRYPANVILDEDAAAALDEMSGDVGQKVKPGYARKSSKFNGNVYQPASTGQNGGIDTGAEYTDSGGASRFFYCAKASKRERGEYNTHPCVKPLSLVEYLCKITRTPTGGVILDPFAGSMTTALAAIKTGRDYIMIEQDADYVAIGKRRIADLLAQGVQMELL